MDVDEVKFFKPGDVVPDFLILYKNKIIFKIDVIVKQEIQKNYFRSYLIYKLYPNKKSVKHFSDFFDGCTKILKWNTKVYKDPPGLKWRILNGC